MVLTPRVCWAEGAVQRADLTAAAAAGREEEETAAETNERREMLEAEDRDRVAGPRRALATGLADISGGREL